MIKCPNCSADLKLDAKSKKIVCSYCGSSFKASELRTKVNKAEEKKKKEEIDPNNSYEAKSYLCSQCGATLLTFDETAITFCSYCGSQAMIESKMIKVNNPDLIIPFQRTKKECVDNYKNKIRKAIFAPSYMKSNVVISKFRGIYMPYVVYRMSYHNVCSNTGSKRKCRKGDYVYYNDYAITTNVDTDYEGVSYDLLSKFYDKYSMAIPFDFKEAEEFNINYLAGYYADTKDVENETYDKIITGITRYDSGKKLRKEIRAIRKYHCENVVVPVRVEQRQMGIFPVYFLAVRDKKNEHINYAVVNGQTGKVAADIPIDFKKYVIGTILLSILIFFLIDESIVLLPSEILGLSLFASVISLIVSNLQINKLSTTREHFDDLGFVSTKEWGEKEKREMYEIVDNIVEKEQNYRENTYLKFIKRIVMSIIVLFLLAWLLDPNNAPNSTSWKDFSQMTLGILYFITLLYCVYAIGTFTVHFFSNISKKEFKSTPKKIKIPFKEKVKKYLYKQLIPIVIGALILMINPVDDIYYYLGSILCFTFVIYSFGDLIREHNDIVSHKLPQLEKRGGDEND